MQVRGPAEDFVGQFFPILSRSQRSWEVLPNDPVFSSNSSLGYFAYFGFGKDYLATAILNAEQMSGVLQFFIPKAFTGYHFHHGAPTGSAAQAYHPCE